MAKGKSKRPIISEGEWLWRLDSIEQELERLVPASNIKTLFTFKLDRDRESDLDFGSSKELDRFPYGTILWTTGSFIWGNIGEEDSAMWLNLSSSEFPFFLCWSLDTGWSVHDLPPKGLKFVYKETNCLWSRYFYLENTSGKQRPPDGQKLEKELIRLFDSIGSCCDYVPETILRKLGNLFLLPCWPTALFYMALKKAHPLLSATGWMSPHPSKDDTIWQKMFDGCVMLDPDLRSATGYALNALKQFSKPVEPNRRGLLGPEDEWITVKDAASILGIDPGNVTRNKQINTNGRTKHAKKLSKLSTLAFKQSREERDTKKDLRDLQSDARRIPQQH